MQGAAEGVGKNAVAADGGPWHKWPASGRKDVMVFKPNYNQQRAERNRAKQAKQEAKQEAKREQRRLSESGAPEAEAVDGPAVAPGPGKDEHTV